MDRTVLSFLISCRVLVLENLVNRIARFNERYGSSATIQFTVFRWTIWFIRTMRVGIKALHGCFFFFFFGDINDDVSDDVNNDLVEGYAVVTKGSVRF